MNNALIEERRHALQEKVNSLAGTLNELVTLPNSKAHKRALILVAQVVEMSISLKLILEGAVYGEARAHEGQEKEDTN